MIKDNWYCCPNCGQKIFKTDKEAVVKGIEVKCKRCRKTVKVNINMSQ